MRSYVQMGSLNRYPDDPDERIIGAGGFVSPLQLLGHEVDPKKHEGIKFAKTICEYLNSAHASKRFEKLYIMAAPSFLGEIRHNLSRPVSQAVSEEIAKNITRMDPGVIREHLPDFL